MRHSNPLSKDFRRKRTNMGFVQRTSFCRQVFVASVFRDALLVGSDMLTWQKMRHGTTNRVNSLLCGVEGLRFGVPHVLMQKSCRLGLNHPVSNHAAMLAKRAWETRSSWFCRAMRSCASLGKKLPIPSWVPLSAMRLPFFPLCVRLVSALAAPPNLVRHVPTMCRYVYALSS